MHSREGILQTCFVESALKHPNLKSISSNKKEVDIYLKEMNN